MKYCYRSILGLAIAVLFCAALPSSTLLAQMEVDSSYLSVGAYGAFQGVWHATTIPGIPGVPTCAPGFDGGSGSGFALGVFGEYRLFPLLAVQLRVGTSSSKATFATQEYIGNALDNGQVVQALTEHTIEPTLGMIDLEPQLVLRPFTIPLSISLGMQFGIVTTSDYEQKETIVSPTNVRFYGGLVRNRSTGEIPGAASTHSAVLAGVGYEFPLSKKLSVTPEISYRIGLSNVMTDTSWTMSALRVGASFRFDVGRNDPSDTFGINPDLSASITASKLDSFRNEGSMASMRVEEFVSPQLRPLLNYVFFDEGVGTMPARYTRLAPAQVSRFNLGSLQNLDVLPTYYNLLNVVGWRMRQNPTATLSLTGCNSDQGAEKGRKDLARTRAEDVRNYLRDVWNIEEGRITVDARNLPEKPSSSSSPDGMAENRRVELRSSVPEILDPVFTIDTVLVTEPGAVRFVPSVSSVAGVDSWRVVATQGGRELKTFTGVGNPPPVIEWDIEADRASIPRGNSPVEYRLEVTDLAHQNVVTPLGTFNVEQLTVKEKRDRGMADKQIDKYSLILFEYGRSEISDANRRIVDFIRQRIAPGAKVAVTGHTDRAGDAGINQRLSEERARSTQRALNYPGATYEGLGESVLLYDNDLPEGRFYCRVVNVVVETTINK